MAKAEYKSAIRSRKLINAALADLLLEKPLDKITVTDVVRKAEINRGTFYAHYQDINDVINHWIEGAFSQIRTALSEPPKDLKKVPHILLVKIQKILERDLEFYRKIMNSSAAVLIKEQLVSVVLEYMLEHEREFSNGSYELYGLKVRFCAGGLSNLYGDWFAGNLAISLDELTIQAEKIIESFIEVA